MRGVELDSDCALQLGCWGFIVHNLTRPLTLTVATALAPPNLTAVARPVSSWPSPKFFEETSLKPIC